MSTATVGTSIITHSTIEQRAEALTTSVRPESIRIIDEAVRTGTLATFMETGMWHALNGRQQRWVESEFDLKTCPVKEGDTIEVLRENANMALVSAGAPAVIDRIDAGLNNYHTGPMVRPDGRPRREGWYFQRANFRVIPQPDRKPDFYGMRAGFFWDGLISRIEVAVSEYVKTCDCPQCVALRGGPEQFISLVRGAGLWPEGWDSTGAEKAFAGEVIRWARSLVVARMFEQRPDTLTLGRPEPTVTTEPEAPVGSPNPEPVVIEEIPTPEALAARITELTTTVERLNRQMTTLSEENVRLRTWQEAAIADADKFSETLGNIADRRELCSEFEEAIERANRATSVLEFKGRRREVEVTFEGSMTVPYSYSATITVESGETIEDAASSWWSDNMSPDEVRSNGEVHWYDASFDDDPDTTY